VFAAYYLWTVQPSFGDQSDESSVYNMLADAFVHGQTSLLVKPKPELLALPDPYDPTQNGIYRLHDMSLYKGKYYAYFGPAAAALVFLPWQVLFGSPLPDRLAVGLFALGAFIAACQILRMMIARWYPATSPRLYYFLCVTLGFCNTYPFLLRRPAVYEVAISSSQLFLLTGVALVLKAAFERGSVRWSAAAGAMLGVAILSRASLVLATGVVVLLYILDRGDSREHRRKKFAVAVLPVIAAVAVFALYNWVRFDSPLEFGTHYELGATHPAKSELFSAARLPLQSYLLVLYPPKLTATFPFLYARRPDWPTGDTYMAFEHVTGIVWASPLLLLLPLIFRALRRERGHVRYELICVVAALLGAGALLFVPDVALLATMRYEADFATLFFLAASMGIVGAFQQLERRRRIVLIWATGALSLFGIALNAAIGLMGYYGGLDISAPRQFHALETLFSPVAALLRAIGIAP
jgi:4-amino-4-deoxy-L-arabinose transferase-like glycosyltransferase